MLHQAHLVSKPSHWGSKFEKFIVRALETWWRPFSGGRSCGEARSSREDLILNMFATIIQASVARKQAHFTTKLCTIDNYAWSAHQMIRIVARVQDHRTTGRDRALMSVGPPNTEKASYAPAVRVSQCFLRFLFSPRALLRLRSSYIRVLEPH